MRDTSLEAYEHILTTGILGRDRTRCYRIIYEKGPLAQYELEEFEGNKVNRGSLPKRVAELESIGVVRIVGDKINPRSGRRCHLYDVTAHVPTEPYRAKRARRCPTCNQTIGPGVKLKGQGELF